jgi:hypothetical protein
MRSLRTSRRAQRGGALLAVLWLAAALSAIAFTLAATVRAELERAEATVEGVQAYYLAQGAIERFVWHLETSAYADPRREGPGFRPGLRRMRWATATGVVDLEITGEGGKLSVYGAPPPALARLFASLGVDGGRAQAIAGGIAARRSQQNLGPGSSFSPMFPSFLQSEDLLMVPGMSPEIYYGWWERDAEGRLGLRGGLWQHVTVFDEAGINVNYASPQVLRAVGVPDGPLAGILQARESQVIESAAAFGAGSLPGGMSLTGGGSAAYTVRATAQLNGRPTRRTVAALVRYGKNPNEPPVGIVRWYPAGS